MNQPISAVIKDRLMANGVKHFASDNISDYIDDKELPLLVDELAEQFGGVLATLLIDTDNDPNSKGTARRLAKMYINELMAGRYTKEPPVTAFPNIDDDTRFTGLLVVQADVKSMCSHHHQIVDGRCWIGIIPSTHVIGLSKYQRLVTWLARRGTLQEELTRDIARSIMNHTKSGDVAVCIKSRHGCCENRGIMSKDSLTTTMSLNGQFFGGPLRQEFMCQIPQTI